MDVLEWLKKNKNHAVLWQCNKCDLFSINTDKKCMYCGNSMHSNSTKRRLYTTNDIEEALKQCK